MCSRSIITFLGNIFVTTVSRHTEGEIGRVRRRLGALKRICNNQKIRKDEYLRMNHHPQLTIISSLSAPIECLL